MLATLRYGGGGLLFIGDAVCVVFRELSESYVTAANWSFVAGTSRTAAS